MTPEVCALHHCISSLHSLSGPLTWVTECSLVVQGKLQASTVLWRLLTSSTAFGLVPTPPSMSPSCSGRRAHHHSHCAAHACAQMTCDLLFHCPNMDISMFSNRQSGTGPEQPWPNEWTACRELHSQALRRHVHGAHSSSRSVQRGCIPKEGSV